MGTTRYFAAALFLFSHFNLSVQGTAMVKWPYTTAGYLRNTPDTLQTNKGPCIIQPVQHASLVLSVPGTTIYVDPTGGMKNYKDMAAPGIILVTDIHGDHFDVKTNDSIKTASTVFIVPQVVADKLPGVDIAKLVILKNGDNTVQSGISIMAIPMYNLPRKPNCQAYKRKR
ncbi:MAG: MBL fold metallo-hydrolase [Chitinophagaceae bacterium]